MTSPKGWRHMPVNNKVPETLAPQGIVGFGHRRLKKKKSEV